MSKWKWLKYAVLLAVNVVVIVLTWISPEPPTKIAITVWVLVAAIWMSVVFVYDFSRGKK